MNPGATFCIQDTLPLVSSKPSDFKLLISRISTLLYGILEQYLLFMDGLGNAKHSSFQGNNWWFALSQIWVIMDGPATWILVAPRDMFHHENSYANFYSHRTEDSHKSMHLPHTLVRTTGGCFRAEQGNSAEGFRCISNDGLCFGEEHHHAGSILG